MNKESNSRDPSGLFSVNLDTTITLTPFMESQPTSSSATPGSSPWKSSGKSRHSISAVPFTESQGAGEAGEEAEDERRRPGRRRRKILQ